MKLKTSFIGLFALVLGACADLHDVEHSWCAPAAPIVVKKETTTELITLSADALFHFDKYQVKDLLPEGKNSLDQLVDKVKNGYAQIESIDLIGYTDRLGSDQYNYKLGLNRANTVKAYLESKGITSTITTSSLAKAKPVTTSCVGNKATPELTACLQPDRRVEVILKGVRKVTK